MALDYKTEQRTQALVLQCLFASVAQPSGPSVGEIKKFVDKHGALSVSEYQLGRIIGDLKKGKYVEARAKKHGKRTITRYSITTAGTYLLLGSVSFLPRHIMVAMTELAFKVATGAQSLIEAYHSQGVTHG